jgi:pyruvate/2-oxoglutarate dehydrogenase complex dihydrolipoamide dehydrogenase (E3) component
LSLNWPVAVERARRIVAGCADPKPANLTAHGAQLIFGQAHFADAHTIVVNGRHLVGKHILIATGLQVQRLPIPGIEQTITHVEALQLEQPPQRLAIIGGGMIAMEFAFIFARAGSHVVLLARHQVLARLDQEIRESVTDYAQHLGIEIRTFTQARAIIPEGNRYLLRIESEDGSQVEERFDHVLLAAGQLPAIDDLGLENIGVHYTSAGISTDTALRTSVEHIWAAGDVREGALKLSQIASSEGKLVARNALSGHVMELNERIVPYLIGLTPPVAVVGLTEEEAQDAGYKVGVHRQTYREVCPAGNVVGEPEGFLKVVFDAASGKLLGAHAFGSGSPELVQQIAFAMLGGLTLRQAGAALYTFPGLCEVVWYALRPHPGDPV